MAKHTKKEIPKGELNRVDKLHANLAFGAMSMMLNLPKKIDELKCLPAYVKDGEVFDFNDRSFGATYKPDGEIFSVEKVNGAQAVTQALKNNYTKALNEWMKVSEDDAKTEQAEKPKKEKKSKSEDDTADEPELDLVANVTGLLNEGKLKKANKLIKENPDHPKAKKAKKLYKKAVKAKGDE